MSSDIIDTFEDHRSELVGLAYRLTGSRADAEDIVQDSFMKWSDSDHQSIHSPRAWLMTIVSRLALDYLKSARVRRVSYVGPWLPEPFIDEHKSSEQALDNVAEEKSPDKVAELDESISMALLVLLEELTPAERASFILHDLFHFEFDEIGEILEKSSSACRKLASRARSKVGKDDITANINAGDHQQMLTAFFEAIKHGELNGLVSLLKENVVMHSDGGGKALAAKKILHGANTVAKFLLAKVRPSFIAGDTENITIAMTWFNGSPGIIVRQKNMPVTAFNFELEDGKINKIHALRNPDKLRLFGVGN